MKEITRSDIYYTLGEYVSHFDHGNLDMPIDKAEEIKALAYEIALHEGVNIKEKHGSGLNEKQKTMILPRSIWEESFKQTKL